MGVLFSCPVEEEEDVGGNAGVEPTALKPSLGSDKLRFQGSLGSLIRREQQSPSARLQVDATKIPATSPRATVAPVPPVMPTELARTRFADAAPESPKHEAAAVTVQKVYKSFRTRRRLADCAVVVEQSWCVRRPSYTYLFFQNPRPHCAAFVCLLDADPCVSIDAVPAGGSCWISRCSGEAPSPSLTSRGRSRRCPSGRGQEPELPRFGSHQSSSSFSSPNSFDVRLLTAFANHTKFRLAKGCPRMRRPRNLRCSTGSKL
jgi:hypothetical protein